MAIVLVAVLILAGSIWIAIRMEAGLDRPPVTRDGGPGRGLRSCELRCAGMTVGHAYPVRPARCRLQHSVANHGTANNGAANNGAANNGAANNGAANNGAANPAATRPARCTDSAVVHGVPQRHRPVAYPEHARA
jgi:hypothetical protein